VFAIDDLVHEIAAFLNIREPAIRSIASSTLNQSAKRPSRTGFDLTKARALLDYRPMTLAESLELLQQEQIKLKK
jgi:dTDP-4-dehydrorhamnose reductase